MALEAAIGALKVLYKLAKMIKEARDNVIFVRAKLEDTESIEGVIALALQRVSGNIPESILKAQDRRLAIARRTSRQMRLKYDPLFNLLNSLGGSATALKAQATTMRKGIFSASMALSALATMLQRHFDRQEKRTVEMAHHHAIEAGHTTLPTFENLIASIAAFESGPGEAAETAAEMVAMITPITDPKFAALMKVYLRDMEMYKNVRALISDLDSLAHELTNLYKKAEDQDDDSDGSGGKDSSYTDVLCPGKKASQASFVGAGIDLLITDLTNGSHIVSDEVITKAMGLNFAKPRLNLFKRQLGDIEFQNVTTEKFKSFLHEIASKDNIGIAIAAVCRVLVDRLQSVGTDMPPVVARGLASALKIVFPLVGYSLAFGLLMATEELRELHKDDPDEVAAQEAEADEAKMEERLDLIDRFAVDFSEAFTYGFPVDPSLMAPIAIDVSTSFGGMGPTLWRRMQILMAVMAIANVEADKLAIEKCDLALKDELAIATALGNHGNDSQIQKLMETHDKAFDAQKVLGNGEAGTFWVASFGKESYEVQWPRFCLAFVGFFGRQNDAILKRIKFMLLDFRGNVTLENLKAFEANGGSITTSLALLTKTGKLPKTAVADDSSLEQQKGLSSSDSKASRLRLYGVADKV